MPDALVAFADEVGADGPVTCAGGKTQWDFGGTLTAGTREVAAPTGVIAHEPGEMIVRVRAGTTVAELQEAVAARGQEVWLDPADPTRATVGGVIAVGQSGYRRLGHGPVRDTVLEVKAADAGGRIIRSGAPLVKNVTGFDLCRLLVGSLGTLALIAEVVLRCRPRPETEQWWVGQDVDPFDTAARLYRPLAVLWDGVRTWAGLAGYRVDVDDQVRGVLGDRFQPVGEPPPRPGRDTRSVPPSALRLLPDQLGRAGEWLAEVGVGVVHGPEPVLAKVAPPPVAKELVELHRSIKQRFDPTGRLSPGRSVLTS